MTQKKIQMVELDILKQILPICERHNISYYIMGGTLLGAVRHKGFIPWDDDIDIGMKRNDYEKFIKIVKNELPSELIIDNYNYNDSLIYITRIENPNVKIEDKSAQKIKIRNAWIDIFPLDGMPNFKVKRFFHKIKLLYLRLMFKYSIFTEFVNQRLDNRPIYERIFIKIAQIINPERFLNKNKRLRKLDKSLKKYPFEKSKYVVNFMGSYKFKEMFPRKIYEETFLYNFEDVKLIGPKDYNYVLKKLYGNYMKEPENKNHHYVEVI